RAPARRLSSAVRSARARRAASGRLRSRTPAVRARHRGRSLTMAYVWLTDLDQALAAGGVPFTEVPFSYSDPTGAESWRTRGRPASTGGFDPTGVLCHHTASPEGTSTEADL